MIATTERPVQEPYRPAVWVLLRLIHEGRRRLLIAVCSWPKD